MVPKLENKATTAIKTLREQTFQVNGPQLFNSLPIYIRKITKCPLEEFKAQLDFFLERIPNEPSVRGLTPAGCTAMAGTAGTARPVSLNL